MDGHLCTDSKVELECLGAFVYSRSGEWLTNYDHKDDQYPLEIYV